MKEKEMKGMILSIFLILVMFASPGFIISQVVKSVNKDESYANRQAISLSLNYG
jgi:hypothetical protein